MNPVKVGIYDEHKLLLEGISLLLQNGQDIETVFKSNKRDALLNTIKTSPFHVLIINMHTPTLPFFDFLSQLVSMDPKIKLLVISAGTDEQTVMKVIKAGAKGLLAGDSGLGDLVEAIYTLRNGHDYFSKSITHILLNNYISGIKENQNKKNENQNTALTSREIEIVRLWGDGHANKEISEKLFISIRTVESHKNHIMNKLNLRSAVDLVKFAIRNNIIEI